MKNSLVRAGFGAACRPVKTLSGRQSLMPVSPRNHEKLFPRLLGLIVSHIFCWTPGVLVF